MSTSEASRTGRELPSTALQRRRDGELRIVHQAILLVAAGGAPRVVLAGLTVAESILDEARRLGLASGVRVIPIVGAAASVMDLRVEPIAP